MISRKKILDVKITFFNPSVELPIRYLSKPPEAYKETGDTVKVSVLLEGDFSLIFKTFKTTEPNNLIIYDISRFESIKKFWNLKTTSLKKPSKFENFSDVLYLFNEEELPQKFRFTSIKEEFFTTCLSDLTTFNTLQQELGL